MPFGYKAGSGALDQTSRGHGPVDVATLRGRISPGGLHELELSVVSRRCRSTVLRNDHSSEFRRPEISRWCLLLVLTARRRHPIVPENDH